MSDKYEYKGPPFEWYPPEFKKKVLEMSERYGIEPMEIVKQTHRNCMAAIERYVILKKRAQEEERIKREHRRKKRKCRSRKKR